MPNNLDIMVQWIQLHITQDCFREEYETYYEGELRKRLKVASKLGPAADDRLPIALEGNSNLMDIFKLKCQKT